MGQVIAPLLGAALLVLAGNAVARNDQLILPIERALNVEQSPYKIAPDIRVRFGKASAADADPGQPAISVEGSANPFAMNDLNNGGRRVRMSDEAACIDAFRRAVASLQQRARLHKAAAVVGVVSNHHGNEADSADMYECRIGHTRSQVNLLGRLASQP